MVRVWNTGESLHRGDEKCPLPADLAPDELTVERAEELLAKGAAGPRELGVDPDDGREGARAQRSLRSVRAARRARGGLEGEAAARVALLVDGSRDRRPRDRAASCSRCRGSSAPTPRAPRSPRRTVATGRTCKQGHRQPEPRLRGPDLQRHARRGRGDLRPAEAAARPADEAAARRARRQPRHRDAGAGARRSLRSRTSPTARRTRPSRAASTRRRSPSRRRSSCCGSGRRRARRRRRPRRPAKKKAAKKKAAKKTAAKKTAEEERRRRPAKQVDAARRAEPTAIRRPRPRDPRRSRLG